MPANPQSSPEDGPPNPGPGGAPGRLGRARMILFAAGWILLVGGLASSLLAFHAAAAAGPDNSSELAAEMRNTKRYQYNLEYVGGKGNAMSVEIQEWFTGLWHGRQLGTTLAVLAVVSSAACLVLAEALPHLPPFPPEPGPRILPPDKSQ
jgi:hypothetical protein